MSNILNHNRDVISIDLVKENYWDFSLALRDSLTPTAAKPLSPCLAVDIDTDVPVCRNDLMERLVSRTAWAEADCANARPLTNIGLTGLDNGLLYFDPTTMSNKDFMRIYTDSVLDVPDSDAFYLTKVKSIYPELEMDATVVVDGDEEVARLNGGFYQGFFHLPEHDYKALPTVLGDGWKMEFRLKPADFGENPHTLNALHPENRGMFFYIGTRAENKWYYLYKTDLPDPVVKDVYATDYAEDYFGYSDGLNDPYISTRPEQRSVGIEDGYVSPDYLQAETVEPMPYVEDGYLAKDDEIDPSFVPPTDDGFEAGQPNIREIETDNKFITYNRSKDGRMVGDGKDDARYILTERLTKDEENYFTLFHRGKNGCFTIDDIEAYRKEHSKHYDVYADLYKNALGFQITDDGRIGYRYIVKDCDNGGYKVESEYSAVGRVAKNEWSDVSVTVRPAARDQMRISIYVNRRLALVSRSLPLIEMRKLDDIYTRQESVPFNISLGGGTTGLATAVYPDFRTRPNTVLPLEAVFGGTFIGYIRHFRFHTCVPD